jgi:DNA sulfur modification protein DndC
MSEPYKLIKSKKAESIIAEIQSVMLDKETRGVPWVIGFSGGKDSTVLLLLTWIALQRLRESGNEIYSKVYVVCNDTQVENPIISTYVDDVLSYIRKAAVESGLPIQVQKTNPDIENTFWVNVIGKGYPVPNSNFRWCTDRLKIRPTSNFLVKQINEKGSAIVLLGTRYSESETRGRSMRKHEVKNKLLSRHSTETNSFVYAPIRELSLEEIWYLIRAVPTPWGFDNNVLFRIYSDASADDYECPTVVTSKNHSSCGQSRFGCWTCTVVQNDKSMKALVNNGYDWLESLLNFRNELQSGRNESDNRLGFTRDGRNAVSEDGRNIGTYSIDYRIEILKKLLSLQEDLRAKGHDIGLIRQQELIAIQVNWYRDGFFEKSVYDLVNESIKKENFKKKYETEIEDIINKICDNSKDSELIINLVHLQASKSILVNKYGISKDVETLLEKYISDVN